jgi:hypothetical protein
MTDTPKTMPEREPGYRPTEQEAALQQAAIRFASDYGPLPAAREGDMGARGKIADNLLTALSEAGLDVDALLAGPTPGAGAQGQVKALEWREARISDSHPRFTADSIIGRYEVLQWADGSFGGTFTPHDEDESSREFDAVSLEDAKATAQADYASCIEATREPAPGVEDQSVIIERMAQAIRDQNRTHMKQSRPELEFHREWLTDHDLALARAALEAARAATMTVPALEWHEVASPKGYRSQGPLHVMTIYENEIGSWTLDDGEAVSPHATLEAAREAGRGTLERRIRDVCGGTSQSTSAAH